MKGNKGCLFLLLGMAMIISGCGGTSSAQSRGQEGTIVALKEYSISDGKIELYTTEQSVELVITNKGISAHNFVIEELGIDSGILQPGESVTLKIDANVKESIEAKCTLPGHTEAGMVAKVIIGKK
jgi:uncharacterized cupredoxin-like copper-binding protein